MSFLQSVLSSIDPSSAHSPKVASPIKPAMAPKATSSLGQKRKAEPAQSLPTKFTRTLNTKASPTKVVKVQKPLPPKPKPEAPAKTPPKGSFAEIMAKAKAVQENAPKNFGVIKNSAFERTAKLAFPKKGKGRQAVEYNRTVAATAQKQRVDTTASRRQKIAEENRSSSYQGTAKPRPEPSTTTYRGTAGRPASRPVNRRTDTRETFSRYEEEDYESDASSDMEAGFDDVAEEEGAALKSARKEDEEELRQEVAAKKAKEERRMKLAALAARKR